VTLADGTTVCGDIIVATADLPYVYDQLLPRSAVRRPWRPFWQLY
jgi:hypothetical protein